MKTEKWVYSRYKVLGSTDTSTGMGMTWQYKQFLKNNNMTELLKR